MLKVCFKCKVELPLCEFYKHPMMGDGHLNKCKQCTKTDSLNRRAEKLKDQNWVSKERARCRLKTKRARDAGKLQYKPSDLTAKQKWASANTEKILAQRILQRSIKSGLVLRSSTCSKCGKINCSIEAHHNDYTQPLAVEWLCTTCHGLTRHKS